MTRSQRLLFLGLALVIAVTRLMALARGPWDWDEMLFCLAVRDFDVAAHQPHPPGFPLYVALAKLMRFFADSDFHALQTLNVIAAVAVFPLTFFVARALRFPFATSILAATLTAFIPNIWLYGGTAFSDVPALALLLATIALFLRVDPERPRDFLLASLVLGAALLVRPHNAFVAIFPWVGAAVRLLRARRFGNFFAGATITTLLVVIGYGAAAWVTGFDGYAIALAGHRKFVAAHDTWAAPGRPPLLAVVRAQLDPYEAGKVSLLINLFALFGIVAGRRRSIAETLLTFAPYFVFSTFFISHLGYSRHSLSYMPGIAILATEGMVAAGLLLHRMIGRVAGGRAVSARVAIVTTAVLFALVVGRLIWWTPPAFVEPRNSFAPPTAAALWLRDRTDPRATILSDHSMWPWIRYYVPKERQVMVFESNALAHVRDWNRDWYVRSGIGNAKRSMQFRRIRNRTWNVVTQRQFEVFAAPVSELVTFSRGWYAEEGSASEAWRWATKESVALVPPMHGPTELRVRFTVPVDGVGHPVTVRSSMNGQLLGTKVCTVPMNEVRYMFVSRREAANELRLSVSDAITPAGDSRELALMLHDYSLREVVPAAQPMTIAR